MVNLMIFLTTVRGDPAKQNSTSVLKIIPDGSVCSLAVSIF